MFSHWALEATRSFLDAPGPALLAVSGARRCGKTGLLRSALGGRRAIWLGGGGLPAEVLAQDWARSLDEQLPRSGVEVTGEAHPELPEGNPWRLPFAWLDVLSRLAHPPALVMDSADPLLKDRRFVRALGRLASELRAHGRQLHILLAVTDSRLLEEIGLSGSARHGSALGLEAVHLPLGPLGLRDAAAAVPGWPARDVLSTYGLVGGLPDFWSRVDGGLRPATNLSRLLLSPEAPLRPLPDLLIPDALRRSERSLALIRALARGAVAWGDLRDESGAFRTSSELGPYLKGLVDAGLVEASISLDAGPRTRKRRYALTHPLLDFWCGSVIPRLPELDGGGAPGRIILERLEPESRALVQRALPGLVRAYLSNHGEERFPGSAREAGSAWGEGYDLDVVGTLVSGAAVYGHVHWGAAPGADALDRLGEEIRRTRYGFGRESRLPFLFLGEDPAHDLSRRVAQVTGARLLGPADLVGRG